MHFELSSFIPITDTYSAGTTRTYLYVPLTHHLEAAIIDTVFLRRLWQTLQIKFHRLIHTLAGLNQKFAARVMNFPR